ncbi:hypothetical protein KGF56_002418 [Candida oxycetoniae]|uniref:Uncharacterized protein n=1 Tax=Candida oxycetoniae TaxID=497107 RepID=A0AAI9SXG7_9ASCO|nr:uncharacterized protein KGF56_002418 [Candida oxycetoniae]KAI3404788.2 hypothetical protein KGF56_002418 [Candida oxycetoniae]
MSYIANLGGLDGSARDNADSDEADKLTSGGDNSSTAQLVQFSTDGASAIQDQVSLTTAPTLSETSSTSVPTILSSTGITTESSQQITNTEIKNLQSVSFNQWGFTGSQSVWQAPETVTTITSQGSITTTNAGTHSSSLSTVSSSQSSNSTSNGRKLTVFAEKKNSSWKNIVLVFVLGIGLINLI